MRYLWSCVSRARMNPRALGCFTPSVVQSPGMSYVPPPPASVGVTSPPGYPTEPVQRGSSRKVVWIVVTVVLSLVVLVLLFVGAIAFVVFGALRSSEPYQHAVQVAAHDPRVLEKLGAPVRPGWLTAGSINVAGDSGSADLTITLEGAAHKGKLYVVARKSEGEWTYQTLALRPVDDTERIDLLSSAGAVKEK